MGRSANSTSDTINYTYTVTNTGNAAIAGVVVTDDNLTPATGDDFNPAFNGGDTDSDDLLDVGETWTYTAAHHGDAGRARQGAALVNVATVTGTGRPRIPTTRRLRWRRAGPEHREGRRCDVGGFDRRHHQLHLYGDQHGQCGDRRVVVRTTT